MIARVWEICEPHPDVFARDMDPSMFAASLHAVEAGTADPDYTDPERFFAKTFMTRSLENVLEGVLARLLGQPGRGAPVLRLETPFGGGKTHTMVALYHLARHAEAVEGTETGERLRERLNLPHLPRGIRVAVLDGAALDPLGRKAGGRTIRTLWGELAYRLGGEPFYEAMRAADEARVAPGQAALADLLRQAGPALILMDEVMHYLAKARAIRVGDTHLAAQTVAFLRELTAAASEVPQAVLLLSLPASSLEVPAETQAQAEEMFQSVRKVVGRTELIETPVAQDEVFGVLKRRLFRNAGDERAAKRAADAFWKYYREFPQFFPDRLRSPSYRERMQAAYPFHPELVDLLYQRWGPHPQFQRTRGALRLMALVLRRLWNQRPGSAYLIQPHHIDLGDRHIRAEVARLLDGAAFDGIITGDVLERAWEVDRELGKEYDREQLAVGAAAVVMLYSVASGAERPGCTEEELRVALLRPEINPTLAAEALGRLRKRLWYLRDRDHRYFFTAKPNLNKVILDFEQGITSEQVEGSLDEHLRQAAGSGKEGLAPLIAPEDPEAVSEPTRPTLVILPLGREDPEKAREWMNRVAARVTARNLLVFLVPEKGKEGEVRAAVRRLLALQALRQAQAYREMDREDQEEVRRQIQDKEAEVQGLLLGAYTRVFRPAAEGVEELRVMLKRNGKTLAEMVAAVLRDKGLLVESITPEYLRAVIGVGQRHVSLAEILTVLTGSTDQPILVNPEEAVRRAIREGAEKGMFGVKVKDQIFRGSIPDDVFKQRDAALIPIGHPPPPPPPPTQRPSVLRLTASRLNIYPLITLLEQIRNEEVTIELVIRDEQGRLAGKRPELEQLLKNYAIPHEWIEGGEETAP